VAALTELGLGDAGLKWPNDVLVRGKKLAGILCAVLPRGDVVAGIGINLRFAGPPPTPHAISLDETMTFKHDTPDIFAFTFLAHLRELMVAEPEEKKRRVEAVSLTIGRKVQILEPSSGTWAGFAESLDEEGHLVVIDEAGERHALAAADIEHLYQ
jgi:BirA family biotin operon repressor/biotin-[acetyl-CoA-carboxylase] ligase